MPNADILAEIGAARHGGMPVLIGFALETDTDERVIASTRHKLAQKRVDLVVANHADQSIGRDDIRALLVEVRDCQILEPMPKRRRRSDPPPRRPAAPRRSSMKRVILTVVLVTAAYAFSFRPTLAGDPLFWWGMGLPYAVLTAVALYKMWDDGTLLDYLVPKWGDLSIGLATAAVLLLCSLPPRALTLAGHDRPAGLAVPHLHPVGRSRRDPALDLHVGSRDRDRRLGGDRLARHGALRSQRAARRSPSGWIATALLYGACSLPTLHTLRDPIAGPEPLLVTAAFGCGLVWTFTGRREPGASRPPAFSPPSSRTCRRCSSRLPGS